MSKKSLINRNSKRERKAERLSSYREELKSIIKNKDLSLEERFEKSQKLSSLSRDSSPSRQRNRDTLTGRPRGYYSYFGLDRISFRLLARAGQIPGIRSSSW